MLGSAGGAIGSVGGIRGSAGGRIPRTECASDAGSARVRVERLNNNNKAASTASAAGHGGGARRGPHTTRGRRRPVSGRISLIYMY
jgi:hypothetical protein